MARQTKAELELQVAALLAARDKFNKKIVEAIREVQANTCDDAIKHISDFCDAIGIDVPSEPLTVTVTIQVPAGSDMQEVGEEITGELYSYLDGLHINNVGELNLNEDDFSIDYD